MGEVWPVKVRYTGRALRQMTVILAYIGERSPLGAQNVRTRLQARIERLADYPYSGQAVNKHGARRVVVNPYPYVIFYRVEQAEIVVLSVRHTSRR